MFLHKKCAQRNASACCATPRDIHIHTQNASAFYEIKTFRLQNYTRNKNTDALIKSGAICHARTKANGHAQARQLAFAC